MLDGDDRYRIAGFLDDQDPQTWGQSVYGHSILGGWEAFDDLYRGGLRHVAIGFGYVRPRAELADRLRRKGVELVGGVDSSASVSSFAHVDASAIVAAHAVVGPNCVIEQDVIVNDGVIVSHDTQVGAGTNLSPGVCVGGRCVIGRGSIIGLNATILPDMRIGNDTQVGAATLVNRDLPDGVKAYGVPVRQHGPADAFF
jgi:acetyltransferase EpsM